MSESSVAEGTNARERYGDDKEPPKTEKLRREFCDLKTTEIEWGVRSGTISETEYTESSTGSSGGRKALLFSDFGKIIRDFVDFERLKLLRTASMATCSTRSPTI